MAKNTEKKGALGMFENMSNVTRKEPAKNTPKAVENNKTKKANDEIDKKIVEKETIAVISEGNNNADHEIKIVESTKNQGDEKKIFTEEATIQKKTSGRPNTRGKKGKDFQLINIAVPNEIYNTLRELSYEKAAGNMTFYINKLLKEAIENEKNK